MKNSSPRIRPLKHKTLLVLSAALVLTLSPELAPAADSADAAAAPAAATTNAPAKRMTRTVGLDIIQKTVNPDKSVTLVFRWSEKGKQFERSVIVNDATLVVYNGTIRKFSDLSEQETHAKAVATVGDDGVTAKLLRFGKTPVPQDKLTPEQQAMIASLTPPATAASNAALEKRVNGLVASLSLKDAAKEERLRAILTSNLKAVRDAHNTGLNPDASVHKDLIAGLQANLTPEQVETMKNSLTANKLPTTFKVYQQILPNLKPEDAQKILGWLTEAREESLDVKNVEDMAPIFKKYKKEIESYLNSHGYDWATAYKAFVNKQKAGSAQTDDSGKKSK